MNNKYQILLSIGIIFKNEIRCLERCLKSLQPLRDLVPCEIVMADTGATDGSRIIAEKYADILFDFEWINDFSAARNAVMDRCSGKWYLSIDCDEWLDGDVGEIVEFIKNDCGFHYGGITIRNYKSADLDKGDDYGDFTACRMVLMSTGMRYEGDIHERWPSEREGTPKLLVLERVLLHHDGYVFAEPGAAQSKMERNMTLLRERLEADPKNLVTLLQCIESSDGSPECAKYIRIAARGIEEKWIGWKMFGPPILRYAAIYSYRGNLKELDKYIDLAKELFPESIYTRIDVEFTDFGRHWNRKEYKKCIECGEQYLKALDEYESGKFNREDSLTSTLALRASTWKLQVQIFTAASYLYEGQPKRAREILNKISGNQMNTKHVGDCVKVFAHYHSRTNEDSAPLITRLWDEINQPVPDEERAIQRKREFLRMSSELFLSTYQENEKNRFDFQRYSYTLFLPLEGKCILGDAAAILEEKDVSVLKKKIANVENVNELPISVLYDALSKGICFPLQDKPMKLEEMDLLAVRLAQDHERLFELIYTGEVETFTDNRQKMAWRRGLLLAAIRVFDWNESEEGKRLARSYANMENAFLPAFYAPGLLNKDNIDLLPPMHRFGWYLVQAFQALDNGNSIGFTKLLREGLSTCNSMKAMVEFLLENTPELVEAQQPEPSEELKALADQVRAILSSYAPDDPAVTLLKQSEAYQKVAYLIEGIAVPVQGGLVQ